MRFISELMLSPISLCSDSGQISGKVLVYRNPGMHFGDIHVMQAVYIKELEEFVGNAKYGIFFSAKGHRSAAYEMGTGDFDGDMYWVSRNPQVSIFDSFPLSLFFSDGNGILNCN